jgi:protein disulfide-isomerase A6
MLLKSITALTLSSLAIASEVIIANNKNFDDIVYNSNKASLVEFYASWCSHCKTLAPKWDELAEKYSKSNDVQIVKIECEENRVTCNQFGIPGFPTIKLFKGDKESDPIEFEGKRNVDNFIKFVGDNVEQYVYVPKIQSNIVQVSDLDFDKTLLESGKNVFVVFTASWCGHCKNLKPSWEELANVFAHDDDVIIAEVSITDSPADELKSRFDIRGFPTILSFKANDPKVIEFASGRDINGLVGWVNQIAGKQRATDGSLLSTYGRLPELDSKVAELFKESSSNINELAVDIISQIRDETEENSKYYRKLLNKIVNGEEAFFEKETARLKKLLKNSKSLSRDKLDSLQRRLNILQAFK